MTPERKMKMILNKPNLPVENSAAAKPAQNWDALSVARLIRENSTAAISPSFLYLGRAETKLLRDHLAEAFGAASVMTLHETYYMGLKVVSVDADSYLQTGGRKIIRSEYLPSLLNAS
jgi:hypothetical protein